MSNVIDISTTDIPAFLYLDVPYENLPQNRIKEVHMSVLSGDGTCINVRCNICPLDSNGSCTREENLRRFIPIDKYPEYHI
jgi:hypothetical protein